jgi:PKD repeat protein
VATTLVTVSPPDLVASFDYAPEPADILAGDAVTFSDTSTTDGPDIVSWLWDFGDGETSTEQHPAHTYTEVGTFAVSLEVTDALGYHDDEVVTDLVTADPRFAIGKVWAGNGVAGTVLTYTLTATNLGSTAVSVDISDTVPSALSDIHTNGTYDGRDAIWSLLGVLPYNGTATGWLSAVLPCTAGVAIVNDDYGIVSSSEGVVGPAGAPVSFDVLAPTIATDASHTPGRIVVGETVHFTGTASTDGTPLSYEWDFDDGGKGTDLTASHVYTRDGAYTVVFTATDGCGYHDVATTLVTVSPPDLVASFDYVPEPADILAGDDMTFSDTSTTDGPDIVSWLWDFGDGETSTEQHPVHTYTEVGTFAVSLEVTDALGYHDDEVVTDLVTAGPRFAIGKIWAGNGVAGTVLTYTLTVTNLGSTAVSVDISDTVPPALSNVHTNGTYDGRDATWSLLGILPYNGTATGWLSAVLPCTAGVGIVNDDYGIVSSSEGVVGPAGAPVSFDTLAPTLSPTFTQSLTEVKAAETVAFTDTSTTDGTDIVAWTWDFGDGDAAVGRTASHTYDGPGAYTVTLTITDTCGFSESYALPDAVTMSQFQVHLPIILRGRAVLTAGATADEDARPSALLRARSRGGWDR